MRLALILIAVWCLACGGGQGGGNSGGGTGGSGGSSGGGSAGGAGGSGGSDTGSGSGHEARQVSGIPWPPPRCPEWLRIPGCGVTHGR